MSQETDSAVTQAENGATEKDGEPVEIEHEPPRLLQQIATAVGLLGAVTVGPFNFLAAPFAFGGVAVLIVGIWYRNSRSWVTVGAGMMLMGVLITGAYGAVDPELLIIGCALIILAWDTAQHAVGIGEELGRHVRTRRVQLVHVGGTTFAISLVATIVYASYAVGADGRPAPGVMFALLGLVLFAWLFRR